MSICISIYLTIYLPNYLPIYLSHYPSIYLSISLSIYLTIYLSISSRLFLLCKGADSSVLRCCLKDGTEYTTQCMARIDEFASTGLRTLVSACKVVSSYHHHHLRRHHHHHHIIKVVSEEAANQWLQGYRAAANSISNRSELLAACARQIETGMVMVGAIGIEDELQDGEHA